MKISKEKLLEMIEEEIKAIDFNLVSKKLVHKHNLPLWGEVKVFCLVLIVKIKIANNFIFLS